jgi:hypothetical protein
MTLIKGIFTDFLLFVLVLEPQLFPTSAPQHLSSSAAFRKIITHNRYKTYNGYRA